MKKIYTLILILSAITTILQAQIHLPIPHRHRTRYLLNFATSSVSVAFSVSRKLKRDYDGPLIRVARDNDQVQKDIPIVNNEVDYEFLKNFIGSSNARIIKIYDQSGNKNDATIARINRGGYITSEGGVLLLTADTKKLTMRFGTNEINSYFNLKRSLTNDNLSAIYVGKTNNETTTSTLGVGGSGIIKVSHSRFSFNLITAKSENKIGMTLYDIMDYPSTLIAPTKLSCIMWIKKALSRTVNIYLNQQSDSVIIDNGQRVFLFNKLIDNSHEGSQDFQEFVYFNQVLSDDQRLGVLKNINQFYVKP